MNLTRIPLSSRTQSELDAILAESKAGSQARYHRMQETSRTLSIEGYEEEVLLASDLDDAKQRFHQQIMAQPWVQALLDQRQFDNENRVSCQGRTYEVMGVHLEQLKMHGLSDVRFLGFDLIKVPEDKYLSDHFEDGQRIEYVTDRNFHLRVPETVAL